MRKAAEPGLVERIASFLGDNGYTRAWAEGVDRSVITPIELQFVKEMPPVDRFNAFASRLIGSDARLNDQGIAFVKAVRHGHDDTPEKQQAMVDALLGLAEGEGSLESKEEAVLGGLHQLAGKAKGEGLKSGLDVLAPRNGRAGYTEFGRQVREMGLGSPVAAYGLPAVGIGLGAWGAHDLLMAQQQAEKDSQLPLQGGQQL